MTASRCCTCQAVRPSLLKGEREVQAMGEVVHPMDLLEEVDLATLLILEEEEEGEMDPLVIPLEGEVTQLRDLT